MSTGKFKWGANVGNNFAAVAVKAASDENDPVAVKSREKVPLGSGTCVVLKCLLTLHISCRRKE